MEDLSNIVRIRRFTWAGHILRLPSDRPASVATSYAVGTRWTQEKTSKKDLPTNIPGRFIGDQSLLEWCLQSGQWSESVEKFRHPMLQQQWKGLSLSLSKSTGTVPSLWTWLLWRYHVTHNVLLVRNKMRKGSKNGNRKKRTVECI